MREMVCRTNWSWNLKRAGGLRAKIGKGPEALEGVVIRCLLWSEATEGGGRVALKGEARITASMWVRRGHL